MSHRRPTESETINKQVKQLNLTVIAILLLLLAVSFFTIVRFFVVPLVLASVFTTLFYPLYQWMLEKVFRGRKTPASIFACLLLMICVFGPVYLVIYMVSLQTIDIYYSSEKWLRQILQQEISFPPEFIKNYPIYHQLHLDEINWQQNILDIFKSSGKVVTLVVNKTSASAFELVANAFLTLFTMFYFFKDGDGIVSRLRYLSPLRPQYEKLIMRRFVLVSRATIKGTVIIGLAQGLLGSLVLLILGFNTWLLWGVVMIILSIIPIVGSYFVLVPAAVYLFLSGRFVGGIVSIVAATLINYGIDYFMRPRLVGHDTKVHDLIIFFSTLGGLAVFGVMGFVVGPVIAMLFMTLVTIYAKEFERHLNVANSQSP